MRPRVVLLPAVILAALVLTAAAPRQDAQELKQAASDVPRLAEVLGLTPGMRVADVGAGAGAMTLVMARWIGPDGRVYSNDVNKAAVRSIRRAADRAQLRNVVTVLGSQTSTNLPRACCDAIWLRDVYHHLTTPSAEDASLLASLKAGGRLAVIDFPPMPGSKPPPGVPADRTGHGILSSIVERELASAGFTIVRTIEPWPPPPDKGDYFLVLAQKPASHEAR